MNASIGSSDTPGTARASSSQTQDAVLRNLHTLSESTQHLSDPLKERYPQVPWRSISAFRNVVVHAYLNISIEQIWTIIERDLPPMQQQVARIMGDLHIE